MRLYSTIAIVSAFLLPLWAEAASRTEVRQIEDAISKAEAGISRYAAPVAERGVVGRLTQGSLRFSSRDYEGALALLKPLLLVKLSPSEYANVLWMVAESLFQRGDNQVAMRSFEQLARVQSKEQESATLVRIMELADRLNDDAKFQSTFNQYAASAAKLEPTVRYLVGKRLFLSGSNAAAVTYLEGVPKGATAYPRARYVLGSALLKAGKADAAVAIFDKLAKIRVSSLNDRAVKDLAIMGKARAYYAQDKMRESVLAYRSLPMDSRYVGEMLNELCFAFIRYGDSTRNNTDTRVLEAVKIQSSRRLYESAYRTLQMLLMWDKTAATSLRARLIYADLLIRYGNDSRALAFFEGVSTELNSVESLLARAAKEPGALLASSEQGTAEKWLARQPEKTRVDAVRAQLVQGQKSLEALMGEYSQFATNLKKELVSSDAFLAGSLRKVLALEAGILELKRQETSEHLEKVTGGLGAGGKVALRFRSTAKQYVPKSVEVSLDGSPVYSGVLPVPGTRLSDWTLFVEKRLTRGRHRLEVAVGLGGLAQRTKVATDFVATSDVAQRVDLELVAPKPGEARPELSLVNGSEITAYTALSDAEWAKLEASLKQGASLEQEWNGLMRQTQSNPRAYQDVFARYMNQLKEQDSILYAASLRASAGRLSLVPEKTSLSQLGQRALVLVSIMFSRMEVEHEQLEKAVSDQIQHLQVLARQSDELQRDYEPAAFKALQGAIPEWNARTNEIARAASGGLLQSALREKYKIDRRIGQIEEARAAEVNRVVDDMNAGGGAQ